MKKYLVSKDVVDAFLDGSWDDLEDFRTDDSWGNNEIVELPPGARVLTKQQILALLGDAGCEWAYANELADELFGPES